MTRVNFTFTVFIFFLLASCVDKNSSLSKDEKKENTQVPKTETLRVTQIRLSGDIHKQFYGVGDVIALVLTFNKNVIINTGGGKYFPRISLRIGNQTKYALYHSESQEFRYLVQGSDENTDRIETLGDMELNGAHLQFEEGQSDTNLILPRLEQSKGVDTSVESPAGLHFVTPEGSPSNNTAPIIRVVGVEELARITLYGDGDCLNPLSSAVVVSQGSNEALISSHSLGSGDRTFTYYARQVDKAGNRSPCSQASLSYHLDQTAPSQPGELSLEIPISSPQSDPTPLIRVGGVEQKAWVTLYGNSACSNSLSSATRVLEGSSDVIIRSHYLGQDRRVTYYARQVDEAGNLSLCSHAHVAYELDQTAPAAPSGLSLEQPDTSPSNDLSPTIRVSGVESGAWVMLYGDSSCLDSSSLSLATQVTEGSNDVLITSQNLSTGQGVSYYARQTDLANNRSLCSHESIFYEHTTDTHIIADPCAASTDPFPQAAPQNSYTSWDPNVFRDGLDLKTSTALIAAYFSSSDNDLCGLDPAEQMMKAWNDASTYNFFRTPSGEVDNLEVTGDGTDDVFGYLADNTMGIYLLGDWYSHPDYDSTLAVTVTARSRSTQKLVTGDIIFNGTRSFTLSSSLILFYYDFYTVLLHELGHFLGLGHTSQSDDSVMVPSVSYSDRIRSPRSLDVSTLNIFYPVVAPSSSPVKSSSLNSSSDQKENLPFIDDEDWVEKEGEDGLVYRRIHLRDDGTCAHYAKGGRLIWEHTLFYPIGEKIIPFK